MISASKNLNPFQQMGYFVYLPDENVYITVKSPLAVWFSLGKDLGKVNLTDIYLEEKDMLLLIRCNQAQELLNYFPQFSPLYLKMNKIFVSLC